VGPEVYLQQDKVFLIACPCFWWRKNTYNNEIRRIRQKYNRGV